MPVSRGYEGLNPFFHFLNNHNTNHVILEYSTEERSDLIPTIVRTSQTKTSIQFQGIFSFFQIVADLENRHFSNQLLHLNFVSPHFSGSIDFQKKSIQLIFHSFTNLHQTIVDLLEIPFSQYELNFKIIYPREIPSSVALHRDPIH